MSNNIVEGLDAIIATGGSAKGGISRANRNRRAKGGRAAGKPVGKTIAASLRAVKQKKNDKILAAAAAMDPISSARRVMVSNLPRDVDEAAVRSFFQSKIGPIRKVTGTYDSRGASTGSYTITFARSGSAKKLSEQFNNEPIDGGKARLSVQILLNAEQVTPKKSLADRIGETKAQPQKSGKNQPRKQTKKQENAVKAAKKGTGNKKAPRKPRTAAQLDEEMSDYFNTANSGSSNSGAGNSEISV